MTSRMTDDPLEHMTRQDWRDLAIAIAALPYTLATIAAAWLTHLARRHDRQAR